MNVQPINNTNNPKFGYLNIENPRRLARKLSKLEDKERGVDVLSVMGQLYNKLNTTKYLHGNLKYGKNDAGERTPILNVMFPENLVLPPIGTYKINNIDGSTTNCKVLTDLEDRCYSFINLDNKDKSLYLSNKRIKDGNNIYDINNQCGPYYDSKHGNKYFLVPFGELFVNQILSADNILQAFAEGRATNINNYEPLDGYPYYDNYSSYRNFFAAYNRIMNN